MGPDSGEHPFFPFAPFWGKEHPDPLEDRDLYDYRPGSYTSGPSTPEDP